MKWGINGVNIETIFDCDWLEGVQMGPITMEEEGGNEP